MYIAIFLFSFVYILQISLKNFAIFELGTGFGRNFN